MTNPEWSLSYWIRGQPLNEYGIVQVPSDTSVYTLLNLIIQESVALSQHERLSIDIYKISDDAPVPVGKSMKDFLGSLYICAW